MLNVRLAGGHRYGKQLFTWLSLVVSLLASFVLSIFPQDVLDEIWDVIESVSEGFPTYSFTFEEIAVFFGKLSLEYFITFTCKHRFSVLHSRLISDSAHHKYILSCCCAVSNDFLLF